MIRKIKTIVNDKNISTKPIFQLKILRDPVQNKRDSY